MCCIFTTIIVQSSFSEYFKKYERITKKGNNMNNNEKKYELIPAVFEGRKYGDDSQAFRVKALKDFSNVKVGELGGFVTDENTLSQEGDCWIYPESYVGRGCKVQDKAMISEGAFIIGNVQIKGFSNIRGDICIAGNDVTIVDSNIMSLDSLNPVSITGNHLNIMESTITTSIIAQGNSIEYGRIISPEDILTYKSPNNNIDIIVYKGESPEQYEYNGKIGNRLVGGDYDNMVSEFSKVDKKQSKSKIKELALAIHVIDNWMKDKDFKDDIEQSQNEKQ